MQFSEYWLRTLVNPALDSAALAHLLTMAGLEVEESLPVAPPFEQVVVAEVLSVDKHPDADKLKLCAVAVGQDQPLQIVCGAPNVAAGMKVPCALIGARLPGITIKKAKVRGVESFGMLCSARELGITEDDQGGLLALAADAPVGQSIREYLHLDDQLLTLKLTPNRADCLSLAGIAREVAALTGTPLNLPTIAPVAATHDAQRAIVLDAPQACPRYCGRVIKGVNAAAATPQWMVQALARSGIRSISASVDVTNYVMLELGQPLHAFDNALLSGAIHVRLPQPGEQLELLNEQTITPHPASPLIADEAHGGRALALAGIMGGAETGVTDATTEIFLESAFFTPDAIAGKARELGFASDASYRFERGVDFELPRRAMERATRLMLDICGGEPGPVVEAVSLEHLPQRSPVRLRAMRARKVLGIPLDAAQIKALLQRLNFALQESEDSTGNETDISFIVTPPAHRYDIQIEADLIEEVARLYGYDNIPAPTPRGRLAMPSLPETQRLPMQLRHQMAERDYFEVVNYSFIDAAWEADFCANQQPIALANPIASQMNVMRSSLLAGLANTLAYNLKRRSQRVRIFEVGRCFLQADNAASSAQPSAAGYQQPLRLAALCAGPVDPLQWGAKARNVDFYDVKADVETLFGKRSDELSFIKTSHPALHPGRAADILLAGQPVGIIGELHPAWVQKYELSTNNSAPIVFELDLDALGTQPLPHYRPVSRFPAVDRDLALLLPQEQAVQPLIDALRAAAPAIVQDIKLFDLYQGKGVAENQKSLAFHIVMQDTEGTLADAEVDAAMQILLDVARNQFAATLRS